jgi:hypothetical protein
VPGGGGALWGWGVERDPLAPAAAGEVRSAAGSPGGNVRSSAIDDQRVFLLSLVEGACDPTLDEIRDALAARGTTVSVAAV